MTHLQSETLPEAISCCWNLQALHVTDCYELLRLPESIGKLKKLRSLDLSRDWKLEGLPQTIGDCDDLHSLHLISCENLAIFPFKMSQNLQSVNLNGCSRIMQLPNSVVQLEMLKSLNLSFCSDIQELPSSFNWFNLHALKLSWTKLARLPDGIVNLRRLKELDLEGCDELRGMPVGIGKLTQLQRLALFVVGDGKEYARMSELCGLVKLSGDLEVKNIRYIKGSDDDGEKAYLTEKNGLKELKLQWHSSDREIGLEQELALLNRLQPPPGIRKLFIYGYPGQQFASWITEQNESSFSFEGKTKQLDPPHFSHLAHMELADYTNLKHLSGLVNLPSLNTLKLENMSVVESIGGGPFPSLKELHIQKMPHLSVCSMMKTASPAHGEGGESNHEVFQRFPSVTTLQIIKCPNLTMKPSFPSSLESLVLTSSNTRLLLLPGTPDVLGAVAEDFCSASTSNGIMLPSCSPLLKSLTVRRMMVQSSGWGLLQQFTALQSVEISSCNDLIQLPKSMQKLASLQKLKIWNCTSLQMLPDWTGELGSLQRMDIRRCNRLSSLPQSMLQLSSLQYLTVGYCDALELPEWLGKLRSLRSLDVWGLPKLTCLPESLRQLTTLQELKISCFDALNALPEWLGEISSLRRLKIETCPGLTSLPRSMKRLTALEELEIIRCPELRRRYRKGEGQDWDLISHIPHVDIQRITDED
uniref:Uncharacterized protein n=1 Tax=Avena sativa TaxID=4498 RepID=A0ACD5YQT8_AVESA